MTSNLARVTATGLATTGKGCLKSAVLAAGSANATAQIRDGASGAILLSVAAVANASTPWQTSDPDGVFFGTGVHVTLTGTGAAVSVEVE